MAEKKPDKVQKMTDYVNETFPDRDWFDEPASDDDYEQETDDFSYDEEGITDYEDEKKGFFSRRKGAGQGKNPAPDIRTTAASKTFSEIRREREELENPSSKKEKKKNLFRRFILIYCGALLLILIAGGIVFYMFLNTLEKSQPYNTAQEVTAAFNSGSDALAEYLSENSEISIALEPDTDAVIAAYIAQVSSSESTFSYVENSDYVEDAPSYDITLDDETVASVTLASAGKKFFGALNEWEVSEINITDYITDTLEYDIVVPTGASVEVNGVALDESYLTASDETPEILVNSESYISSVPTCDTYHITGLINEPEVSVSDESGTALSLALSDDTYTAFTEASDEFIESVSDRVEAAIQSWGTYFINKSYSLSSYMLSGTEWYTYIFGSDDIDPIYTGFYGSSNISSYTFSEISTENYIRYADDCFTVDVYYYMELTFSTAGYSDDNQTLYATWVWVKSDDTWYIADVVYLDDSEETEDTEDASSDEESEEDDSDEESDEETDEN